MQCFEIFQLTVFVQSSCSNVQTHQAAKQKLLCKTHCTLPVRHYRAHKGSNKLVNKIENLAVIKLDIFLSGGVASRAKRRICGLQPEGGLVTLYVCWMCKFVCSLYHDDTSVLFSQLVLSLPSGQINYRSANGFT